MLLYWILQAIVTQCFFFFHCGAATQRGPWPPQSWGFLDHTTTHHSRVGLLWTSNQLVSETSTWQFRTFTTNNHDLGGIRTHDLSRRAAADLRLRPRGYWDRQHDIIIQYYYNMLWDHRRISGPSLTETLLCGAFHTIMNLNKPVQRLKVATLPLDLSALGP